MIDRLIESIEKLAAPVVVGLDPTLEMIPETMIEDAVKSVGRTPEAAAAAILKFNMEIIDAVTGVVPAVKPNIAFYERYGLEGINAYLKTTGYAAKRGLMVIGDVKRGDIGSTAAAYAGHLEPPELFGLRQEIWNEDAVTLNPYLGEDSIAPFLDVLKARDKGVFILVKTSNKGSADIQDLNIVVNTAGTVLSNTAGTVLSMSFTTQKEPSPLCPTTQKEPSPLCHPLCPLYEHVAELVSAWGEGEGLMGARGYSKVGAVVGATHAEASARLRELMPHTFFLVPGYGAQGAGAKDVRRFFDAKGSGAIVNSSRGIIGAWKAEGKGAGDVGKAARAAALRMIEEIRTVL